MTETRRGGAYGVLLEIQEGVENDRREQQGQIEGDSVILQDIIDFLNSGDSPTWTMATKGNVLDVLDTLFKDYRGMVDAIQDLYHKFGVL